MKKNYKRIIIVALCMIMMTASLSITANAKSGIPRNGRYMDSQGHIYIMKHGKPRTGYFTYHGKHYYGHKTNSKKYPKGSVTRGQFRIRSGNRWYAYSVRGTRYEKDHYIRWGRFKIRPDLKIRKDHTVKYVYCITSTSYMRYSTKELRMQEETTFGKWRTIEGMQFIPYGWVDYQR